MVAPFLFIFAHGLAAGEEAQTVKSENSPIQLPQAIVLPFLLLICMKMLPESSWVSCALGILF